MYSMEKYIYTAADWHFWILYDPVPMTYLVPSVGFDPLYAQQSVRIVTKFIGFNEMFYCRSGELLTP